MSKRIKIECDTRKRSGTGSVRELRRENRVPGVVYGAGEENVNVAMDHDYILHNLENEAFHSSILELVINGEPQKAVLRDVQMHPASDVKVLHVDFMRVSRKEKLTMTVPIHFLHEEDAEGVKMEGGVVFKVMNDIDVTCLPDDLPEAIELDLIELKIGDSISLGEVKLPDGVESATLISGGDPDQMVVAVNAPRAEVEEEPEVEEGEVAEETAAEEGGEADTAESGDE